MISDGASRFVTRWAAGVLLLNLFVYTLAAFMLYASWRGYETRVESSTQNLARIIESSVTGVVDKADVALRSVVDEAERQLAAGGIDAVAITGAIARQTARVPELDGIRLANADGEILYGSDVDPAAAVNVTDREYFQWVRDNPAAATYISKPYVGRIAHRWVFALARRIEHQHQHIRRRFARQLSKDHPASHFLVRAGGIEAVGTRQVGQFHRIAAGQHEPPRLALHGDARIVRDLLARAGQRVEQRAFPGVRVANQCCRTGRGHGAIGSTRMARACARRSATVIRPTDSAIGSRPAKIPR